MASRKASKRQSGQKQDAVSAGKIKSPAARMMPAQSAALDVFAYPHLLSHILDNTNTSTLATLLRCSKGMLKTVSPRLYRKLHLTPLQLKAMLETGWAAKGSSAYSPSLFHCLQQTQTLHLQSYQQDLTYPKVPRGLFANCTRVILHIDESPKGNVYAFPPLFQSLGSHLYIRLTDDAVVRHEFEEGQAVACLSSLPRSFTAVTFLVPNAYRFSVAPSCGYHGTPPTHDPIISVVLLPWAPCAESMALQHTFGARWSTSAASRMVPISHNRIAQYFGMEYTGMLVRDRSLLVLWPPASDAEVRLPADLGFGGWLVELEDETVFTGREWDVLALSHCELARALSVEAHRALRETIQNVSLAPPNEKRSAILAKCKANFEKKTAAHATLDKGIAMFKKRLSRGQSLRPYF